VHAEHGREFDAGHQPAIGLPNIPEQTLAIRRPGRRHRSSSLLSTWRSPNAGDCSGSEAGSRACRVAWALRAGPTATRQSIIAAWSLSVSCRSWRTEVIRPSGVPSGERTSMPYSSANPTKTLSLNPRPRLSHTARPRPPHHRAAPTRDLPGPGRRGRPVGEGVARWVEDDFRVCLRCRILAHGFARAATTAPPSVSSPSRARAAVSAPPATPGGWSRSPPT
jgi:hypothetical protein